MPKGNPNPDTFALKADRAAWLELFKNEALRAGARTIETEYLPKGHFQVRVTVPLADTREAWATIGFTVAGGTHVGGIVGTWNIYRADRFDRSPYRFSKAMEALGPVNPFHRQKATRVLSAPWATHALTADIRMMRDGSAFEPVNQE